MADASLGAFVRHLRQIVSPSTDPRDDRELLNAFAVRQDQAAFAVLVRRHGPMVLNVCRRVLRHEQDAEDAFQATFLVLATKAASLAIRTSIVGFLHGVAYRLALKARRDRARRLRREASVQTPTVPDAAAELSWREAQSIVEEEIQRLPEKYRLPFVLCHLEGLSRAEAGRQLGLKEGTVWSRLSQARARLQQRLARRGIALPAVLGALAVSQTPLRAELCEAIVCAARQWAAGAAAGTVSARVALLTQAGLQTMTGKMKLALVGLVMLLAAGAGGVGYKTLTSKLPQAPSATNPQAKAAPQSKQPDSPQVRRDRHGDPLPDGALARLGTVRWRHGDFVHALAYSPDGKRIISTGVGRALVLWDAATGKELRVFASRGQPRGVAFSPDGKWIATTVRGQLWDVATGNMLRDLQGVRFGLESIAFAPDGKYLATANTDGTVRLWDTATGNERRRIDCGQGQVFAAVFAPDGKLLASGGSDGTIRLWDAATGKEVRRLTGPKKRIMSIAFSPDGKRLASVSKDDSLRLWEVATGRQVRRLGDKQKLLAPIAFSPDGKLLALGSSDGTLNLWDAASGERKRRWRAGRPWGASSVAFSPDGQTLASAMLWDGGIRLWDVATGRERHPAEGHHGPIPLLRFAPDMKTLISAGFDGNILWWNLATQRPRRRFAWTTDNLLFGFALSPDGKTLAAADRQTHEVWLWDLRTGQAAKLPSKHSDSITRVAFSPDGRLLALGERDKAIHVWDVRQGKEVRQIEDFKGSVSALLFSPDCRMLACATAPGGNAKDKPTLCMWDLAGAKQRCIFAYPIHIPGAIAFSPDGKILAMGDGYVGAQGEPLVRLWDTAGGKEFCRHGGHRRGIGAVAFSPDGKLVASGEGAGNDDSIHIWEAATGRLIRRFVGHHSWVWAVTFAADGLTVASGAGDSTILLWDITGRRPDGRWHAKPLTPNQLNDCWISLAKEDAAKAYDAVWALVAAPEQTVPFLCKHLPPVPRPDAKSVARLIADLDNEDFTVRQKATEELSKLGDAITAALRRAIDSKPSLEVRRRIQQLLARTRDWTPQRLRDHRAIQALEHIGTRPARQVLQALAEGAPQARRTEEANAARKRLAR